MNKVSWVKNLVLAIALFLFANMAYWLVYKHKPDEEAQQASGKKVFVLKKGAQIQSVRLDNGSTDFEWDCESLATQSCKSGDNSKWKIVAPLQAQADNSNVNSLVMTLSGLSATDVIDLKDETPEKRAQLLSEYGLAASARAAANARRITIKTSAGTETAYLGATHPINDGIFALADRDGKVDESRVYLIPGYFKSNLGHDLTYWRDKKLMGFLSKDILSFDIKSKKNGTIHGERRKGEWALTGKGGQFSGDIENVDTMLSSAAYLTARDFVSDDKNDAKAKAALRGAHAFLTVDFHREKDQVSLTLYEKQQPKSGKTAGARRESEWKIYALVSNMDPLYEVQPSVRNQLDKGIQDLRLARLLTSMDRFTARRLEFSGKPIGSKPLVLVSKDSKWTLEGDKGTLNAEKIQRTLDRLSGSRIHEFLTGKQIPKGEKDGLVFTFGDAKTPDLRQLVFWKSGGKFFARDLKSTRKEAFLVDDSVAGELPWTRGYFSK